jgi:hypothetical protein
MTADEIKALVERLRDGTNTSWERTFHDCYEAAEALESLLFQLTAKASEGYRRGVREAFNHANIINANRQGRTAEETCAHLIRSLAELANAAPPTAQGDTRS